VSRRWRARYNSAFRPEVLHRPAPAPAPAQADVLTRPARTFDLAALVAADIEVTPTPGAALARTTAMLWPQSVIGELRVCREWLARWEAEPPERRNRAYGAMRDYVAGLQAAVAPYGEWAWWDRWNNY